MLRRRADRTLDEPSQWFGIWSVLFPDSPLPSSPYLSSPYEQSSIEDTLCMLHDYWRRHEDELVAEVAAATTPENDQSAREATLASNLVETLLARFRSNIQDATDVSSSNASPVNLIDSNHSTTRAKYTTLSEGLDELRPRGRFLDDLLPQSSQQETACIIGNSDGYQTQTALGIELVQDAPALLLNLSPPVDITITDEYSSRGTSFCSLESAKSSPYEMSCDAIPSAMENSALYNPVLQEELATIFHNFPLELHPTRTVMCLNEGLNADICDPNEGHAGQSIDIATGSCASYATLDMQLNSNDYDNVNIPQNIWSSFSFDFPDDPISFLRSTN
ncbi:hypothetical protein HJFPF1_10145 [Paramyrothecium foliicola]|nr:hypothetical protein HJFPF1_10145 [Paramyrothecium foliicola]